MIFPDDYWILLVHNNQQNQRDPQTTDAWKTADVFGPTSLKKRKKSFIT